MKEAEEREKLLTAECVFKPTLLRSKSEQKKRNFK